jgi:hypothetical protein
MENIYLNWNDFKNIINDKSKLRYIDRDGFYLCYYTDSQGVFESSLLKDSGTDVTEFETDYKDFANSSSKQEVVTQFEKDDKRLKMACAEEEFDEAGEVEISIAIPSDGRYIAGGNAFTNAFCPGDKVLSVSLVDVDNLLGYGPNTVLASYHDEDVPTANRGWYFEPKSNGTGWIEVEPIGGYGLLLGGTYLLLRFKKEAESTATKVFVNIWWGKKE